MTEAKLSLIWANKPGCRLCVAELWIGRDQLWLTIFVDDNDGKLKLELLPPLHQTASYLLDFTEAEHLIEKAKGDLLAMLGG